VLLILQIKCASLISMKKEIMETCRWAERMAMPNILHEEVADLFLEHFPEMLINEARNYALFLLNERDARNVVGYTDQKRVDAFKQEMRYIEQKYFVTADDIVKKYQLIEKYRTALHEYKKLQDYKIKRESQRIDLKHLSEKDLWEYLEFATNDFLISEKFGMDKTVSATPEFLDYAKRNVRSDLNSHLRRGGIVHDYDELKEQLSNAEEYFL